MRTITPKMVGNTIMLCNIDKLEFSQSNCNITMQWNAMGAHILCVWYFCTSLDSLSPLGVLQNTIQVITAVSAVKC